MELPEYSCHKHVRALKIATIENALLATPHEDTAEEGVRLTFMDERFAPKLLNSAYAHRIKAGDDLGYYVVYEDGFQSWSPTKAFEEGYTKVEPT